MTKLPALKPKEVVAALLKAGFEKDRKRGSHLYLWNETTRRATTVPMHSKEIRREFIRDILKQAGLSEEEFRRLL